MSMSIVKGDKAASMIVDGTAPPNMSVETSLHLTERAGLRIPPHLHVPTLTLSGGTDLTLSDGLRCYELALARTDLRTLPDDIRVESKLDLTDCRQLESLPNGLRGKTLLAPGCVNLKRLPERIKVDVL